MANRVSFKSAAPLKTAKDETGTQAAAPKASKKAAPAFKALHVELTTDAHAQLKALCAANGETISEVTVRLVNQYFVENGKPAIATTPKK